MKRALLLSAILFAAAYSANAQYYYRNSDNASVAKLGVGVSGGVATGPVSGTFSDASALSLTLELPIGKSPVSFRFSTGYTFYVSGSSYGGDYSYYGYDGSTYGYSDVASFIPVEVGLKARVTRRFFIEGDAGVSFNINTYPSNYTGKATAFIYSPAIGYSFPFSQGDRSNLDLSLLYENRPEPGGGYEQVAVRAVLNFGLGNRR